MHAAIFTPDACTTTLLGVLRCGLVKICYIVNQVKFLGLAQTFLTVSPSNIQDIYTKPTQNGTDARVELKEFTVVREVLYTFDIIITDLTISLVLTSFGE